MNYRISYSEEVLKKDLSFIEIKQAKRILVKINKIISSTPKECGNSIRTLKGSLNGLFRLRVGDYRVIYKIFEESNGVLILKIGHRKDIYKKI